MLSLIERVAAWKADTENEESGSFFLENDAFKRTMSGNQFILVGRKGTGKTAIGKNICSNNKGVMLNFDSFHFQGLVDFRDHGHNVEYQYKAIWDYIILSNVIEIMYNSKKFENQEEVIVKNLLRKHDLDGKNSKFQDTKKIDSISEIISSDEIKSGGGAQVGLAVDIFKKFISKYAGNENYYIVVDNIDGDIKASSKFRSTFLVMIGGLLRSARDIRKLYKNNIKVIILMRYDVYGELDETDKWEDNIDRINWTERDIKFLIENKISFELSQLGYVGTYAPELLFSGNYIRMGNKKYSAIDHIFRYSQLRPRDVIGHFRIASTIARNEKLDVVTPSVLKQTLHLYSKFLIDGVRTEMLTKHADVDTILTALSNIGKSAFRYSEFSEQYKNLTRCGEGEAASVAMDLYKFGVVGNHIGVDGQKYIFDDPYSSLNFHKTMFVHNAFMAGLGI